MQCSNHEQSLYTYCFTHTHATHSASYDHAHVVDDVVRSATHTRRPDAPATATSAVHLATRYDAHDIGLLEQPHVLPVLLRCRLHQRAGANAQAPTQGGTNSQTRSALAALSSEGQLST